MIINAFKNEIFPLRNPANIPDYVSEEDISPSSSLDSLRSSSPRGAIAASQRSTSPVNNEDIDPKIIRHCFGFNSLDEIYKLLNEDLVDKDLNERIIDQALTGLKIYIRKLPKKGKQTTQLKLLANSVDKVLNDATNNQQGQGLKVLTPKQMITRLPVLLAQLKAGNNSQKLKNEIRKIAYSLYK